MTENCICEAAAKSWVVNFEAESRSSLRISLRSSNVARGSLGECIKPLTLTITPFIVSDPGAAFVLCSNVDEARVVARQIHFDDGRLLIPPISRVHKLQSSPWRRQ